VWKNENAQVFPLVLALVLATRGLAVLLHDLPVDLVVAEA
jgi:hypothetical protein